MAAVIELQFFPIPSERLRELERQVVKDAFNFC